MAEGGCLAWVLPRAAPGPITQRLHDAYWALHDDPRHRAVRTVLPQLRLWLGDGGDARLGSPVGRRRPGFSLCPQFVNENCAAEQESGVTGRASFHAVKEPTATVARQILF